MCRGKMHYRRCSPCLYCVDVRPSITCRQNLLSLLKTTERHSTLQFAYSRHQSSCAWQCRDVSGRLARGTRDLSPAASRRFLSVLGDRAGATYARIFSLDAVGAATASRKSVLCGRPEPGLRVWECSIDYC